MDTENLKMFGQERLDMSDDEGPSQISPDVPGRIVEFHSGNSQGQVTGDALQVQG